jgi:hypothetical protein
MPVEELALWRAFYDLEAKWKKEAAERAKREAGKAQQGSAGRRRRR